MHRRRLTMAWARLDIDLSGGEALIEEIQSDWIRRAEAWRPNRYRFAIGRDRTGLRSSQYLVRPELYKKYIERTLRPYGAIWSEATLAAALWFLIEELGIRRVFYHTPTSGELMKDIRYGLPPRSLYSDLPRRFCFQQTKEKPRFLPSKRRKAGTDRRKLRDARARATSMYLLDCDEIGRKLIQDCAQISARA